MILQGMAKDYDGAQTGDLVAQKAINDAEMFRFIAKPWQSDELEAGIRLPARVRGLASPALRLRASLDPPRHRLRVCIIELTQRLRHTHAVGLRAVLTRFPFGLNLRDG